MVSGRWSGNLLVRPVATGLAILGTLLALACGDEPPPTSDEVAATTPRPSWGAAWIDFAGSAEVDFPPGIGRFLGVGRGLGGAVITVGDPVDGEGGGPVEGGRALRGLTILGQVGRTVEDLHFREGEHLFLAGQLDANDAAAQR